jgi:hypothetical protein
VVDDETRVVVLLWNGGLKLVDEEQVVVLLWLDTLEVVDEV